MIAETVEDLRKRLEDRSDYRRLAKPVAFWLARRGHYTYEGSLTTVGRFPAGSVILADEVDHVGNIKIILAKPKNEVEARCFTAVASRWGVLTRLSALEALAAQAE